MPKFSIISDGTTRGTQVFLDDEDITNQGGDVLITSVNFTAYADDEYISFGYTQTQPYANEEGEAQGREQINYSYTNAEWFRQKNSAYVPKSIGSGETEDKEKGVGGRILQDASRQSKVKRLLLKP